MAAKKKAKSKKAKSKVKAKKPAAKKTKSRKSKPTVKKAAPKKAVARKPAAKKTVAKMPVTPAAAMGAAPGEERVGVVTHYYNHLSVAIIKLDSGALRRGDTLHIKGHTSDFRQTVGSMEVDHVHVDEVQIGLSFGLRVNEHAREHDVVYKIKA